VETLYPYHAILSYYLHVVMAAKNFTSTRNDEEFKVHMFEGEQVLAKTSHIKRFNCISGQEYGIAGDLIVTNFKIAFTHSVEQVKVGTRKSASLASLDTILTSEQCYLNDVIPLTLIYRIYAISSSKQKRKKVQNAQKEISDNYDIIELELKDFRTICYDFKNADEKERRACFKTISHHAFPKSLTQLFGFDYGSNLKKSFAEEGRAFCMFKHNKDYEMILSRLQSSDDWRVSNVNREFLVCHSLPEFNVCQAALEESDLKEISDSYVDNKFPTWLWNDPKTGAALMISSRAREEKGSSREVVNKSREGVNKSNSTSTLHVSTTDVSSQCPSLKELKNSLKQLRKVCVVHSASDFWTSDSKWLSDVDSTKWLQYVLTCLEVCRRVSKELTEEKKSVCVCDESGCDFSILVTSLVQILLDPYYRTHVGFQALVQKDWVMGGHPFSKRLKNVHDELVEKNDDHHHKGDASSTNPQPPPDNRNNRESPVFFLFLDCVHQLVHQQPMKFEYTEQFLILIADCSYSSLFHTFMFNCDAEFRSSPNSSRLVSAWDFISLNVPLSKYCFTNPAYNLDDISSGNEHVDNNAILPVCTPANIQLWFSYFCRWFPSTNVNKGFTTNVILQLQQKRLVEEITYLQERLHQMQLQSGGAEDVVSVRSGCSSLGRHKKTHKRESSKHENENEDDYGQFFSLMSDFYFLKIL